MTVDIPDCHYIRRFEYPWYRRAFGRFFEERRRDAKLGGWEGFRSTIAAKLGVTVDHVCVTKTFTRIQNAEIALPEEATLEQIARGLGLTETEELIDQFEDWLQRRHAGGSPRTRASSTAPVRAPDEQPLHKRLPVLHVGFGVFPPYTCEPSRHGALPTGFSVDLVNAIAAAASLRIVWHRVLFDGMQRALLDGVIDFMADPIYMVPSRLADYHYCRPYSYFGIAVAVVRRDETRFATFRDLDRADVRIALPKGWTSAEYARRHLSPRPRGPRLDDVPIEGGNWAAQMNKVWSGEADVALNDYPSVKQYVERYKDKVKALWLNNPPKLVAGSFVTRRTDYELRDYLNDLLDCEIADGVLERLDRTWCGFGLLPSYALTKGAGLLRSRTGQRK